MDDLEEWRKRRRRRKRNGIGECDKWSEEVLRE